MINRWQLSQAARSIHQGGVIAYPTEAVFGLGCDPLNPEAVQRILEIKQRDIAKGLILIAADIEQLTPFIAPLEDTALATVQKDWPGPHTWLLPARPETPRWLRGDHDTIAVRVTAHPLAAALCRAAGHALVSTSANPSSRPPARHTLQVRRYFPHELDAVLAGAVGKETGPTPIRDLASGQWTRPPGNK